MDAARERHDSSLFVSRCVSTSGVRLVQSVRASHPPPSARISADCRLVLLGATCQAGAGSASFALRRASSTRAGSVAIAVARGSKSPLRGSRSTAAACRRGPDPTHPARPIADPRPPRGTRAHLLSIAPPPRRPLPRLRSARRLRVGPAVERSASRARRHTPQARSDHTLNISPIFGASRSRLVRSMSTSGNHAAWRDADARLRAFHRALRRSSPSCRRASTVSRTPSALAAVRRSYSSSATCSHWQARRGSTPLARLVLLRDFGRRARRMRIRSPRPSVRHPSPDRARPRRPAIARFG